MRMIYLDKDYLCHLENAVGRRMVETSFFDGKCDEFVEGYRFIPASERWTREDGAEFRGEAVFPVAAYGALEDGAEFRGEAVFPVAAYGALEERQREEEMAAVKLMGSMGDTAPVKMAEILRDSMDIAADKLTDEEALKNVILYSEWRPSVAYGVENKRMHGGVLYKCRQAHSSQDGWEPENAPALWERIDETASGTKDDPVKAARNMEYRDGINYLDPEDENIYLCVRGTGQPVSYLPHELVGVYFEVAA